MTGPLCEVLDWDSRFFDCRIGRVIGKTLNEVVLAEIISWAADESIDCLYFLANEGDEVTCTLAKAAGFDLVDTRVTLESCPISRSPSHNNSAVSVRAFASNDLATLRAIARVSHRDSRFYHDGHFPHDRCDQLYDAWITKSCDGWADTVLVAEVDGKASGYVTCHVDGDRGGRIGLLAVDSQVHLLGIGRELSNAALRWFSDHEVKRVSVVTQGRNAKAIQFYENCGFSLRHSSLWFHKWFRS